ncbi:hypothetical protein H0H87_001904 [Tephrocybe sp. NHM501043]|nr:hypothetical protein H0H87_001904 [Tephrocybe sp. NHM501043]
MADLQNKIVYDWVAAEDVEQAIKIEEQGYPADEAASLEALKYRQANASKLFLGAYLQSPRELIGYICSTLSPSPTLTHASMSTHVPGAQNVCIHSVCVHAQHRKQGVGLSLLKEYVTRLRSSTDAKSKDKEGTETHYERILLITHEYLRQFYEQAGFEWIGPSHVQHGKDPWYEMRLVLADPSTEGMSMLVNSAEEALALPDAGNTESAPPNALYEALVHSSRRPRPAAKLLAAYEAGVENLKVEVPGKEGTWVNRVDLLCPRPGCGSFVLRAGKAEWKVRKSVEMDPPHLTTAPSPHLPKLPAPAKTTDWWLVAPTPMEFENIGFSRAVQGLVTETGRPLKLLACAECDLGPIGWAEDGGKEFWVACSRVGYRE